MLNRPPLFHETKHNAEAPWPYWGLVTSALLWSIATVAVAILVILVNRWPR